MLAFRETKFSRSCRQSYTRLRNGRWLISRSRRLRFSRCWKRRTDYQQNFKAKSRSLTVIRKRRGLVRRPDPANLLRKTAQDFENSRVPFLLLPPTGGGHVTLL